MRVLIYSQSVTFSSWCIIVLCTVLSFFVVADTAVVAAADTAVAVIVAHCYCLYCVLLALAEKH